jgi:hypothetical protein
LSIANHGALLHAAKLLTGNKLFGPYGDRIDGLRDEDFIDDTIAELDSSPSSTLVPQGFQYLPDFLSAEEERGLVEGIENKPWDVDAEGRRVQIYG